MVNMYNNGSDEDAPKIEDDFSDDEDDEFKMADDLNVDDDDEVQAHQTVQLKH